MDPTQKESFIQMVINHGKIWPRIDNYCLLKIGFQMVGFSFSYNYGPNHLKTEWFEIWTNGQILTIAMASNIQKLDHSKSGEFVWISNGFDKMAAICSDLKWLGILFSNLQNLDHFATQPLFDHLKSTLVWFIDSRFR